MINKMKSTHTENMKFGLRLHDITSDSIHDIKEYSIKNENDCKFISDFNNVEFGVDDAEYFIIAKDIFKDIIKSLCKSSKTKVE